MLQFWKILRLILFIPAILLVMALSNFLLDIILHYIVVYFLEGVSFLGKALLKTGSHIIITVTAAAFIYPYEKKFPAFVIVALIYTILMFFLLTIMFGNGEMSGFSETLELNFSAESKLDSLTSMILTVIFMSSWLIKTYKEEYVIKEA